MIKKMITLFFLITLTLHLLAPEFPTLPVERPTPISYFDRLIKAIAMIESSNNPKAINKTEQAYGLLQVRIDKLSDFNRANGTNYILMDCLDEALSRKVFFWHCRGYNDIWLACRRWNGAGEKSFTYLAKIRREFEK